MPTTTFTVYEVPNSYVSSGTSPTITGVFNLTITDNDTLLHSTEGTDPGASQVMTLDGTSVSSYQFYYDDTISINGGTETIKTFQMVIGGVTRSFVMNDDGPNIPGTTVGTSFTLDTYAGYTNIAYNDLLCFMVGTHILTSKGNVVIEKLNVGDLIQTKDHGLQPIRWIGKATVSTRELIARPHLRPILVPANTFARNVPARDLYLSPQHRILLRGWQVELNFGLDEVFAPATTMVGKNGIRIDTSRREVDYFHIMFDRHEVIFSEDLATESFLVGDTIQDGMDQDQLKEILELFPELDTGQFAECNEPARPILRRFEVNTLDSLAA